MNFAPMKLAFCLFNYFPFGGLQRDMIRIAHESIRRGHVVDIYTMRWEGEQDPQLPVTLIPARGWQNNTQCYYFASQVKEVLAKKSYHLIIGFNKMPGLDIYYAADTCFQAKYRIKHGAWYRLTPRYRHFIALEKAVFAHDATANILLLSRHQQTDFIRYYHTPSTRFHLLPPGISKDRIAGNDAPHIRAKLRRAWNIQADEFLLLMIGSGFKTKGLDRILLGINNLPLSLKNRVRLFVIGEDHQEPFYAQAKKLNITDKIHFLGGRTDIPQFLLAGDLLLHPAYNENTGTVLLEALASGLPVLTTDVCGYAHYIQEAQAGIVLPSPFQQRQFNQTLENMLVSPEWLTWQQNALAYAKKADIYEMPERAVDIIESLGHHRATLFTS